jgi:hypothetical protein
MTVLALDPTTGGVDVGAHLALAPRPKSLDGQVLGIIANGLGISEVMFDRLGELLMELDGVAGVVKVVKPSVAVPPWPEQWAEIVEHATVAVTGFGGCGSCSTRSMRDALDLEAIGIPSVCVGHTALMPAVEALARLVGATDYPMIDVGYPANPTGVWLKEEAEGIADLVVDRVRAALTAPQ